MQPLITRQQRQSSVLHVVIFNLALAGHPVHAASMLEFKSLTYNTCQIQAAVVNEK